MSDESTKRRVAFAYLEEVRRLWRVEFAAEERTAIAFGLNDKFGPVLQKQMVG
jgi:hypothetical protein